jgi:hypothetical protein
MLYWEMYVNRDIEYVLAVDGIMLAYISSHEHSNTYMPLADPQNYP